MHLVEVLNRRSGRFETMVATEIVPHGYGSWLIGKRDGEAVRALCLNTSWRYLGGLS